MSPSAERADPRSLAEAAVVGALGVALGVVGGVPILLAGALPVAGAVAAVLLRRRRGVWVREGAIVPLVAGLGSVAAFAAPSLLAGALAGLAGLAILLWYARTPGELGPARDPIDGLALPAIGLGIALLAGVALPAQRSAVGLAALAVVGAVALVLWTVVRTAEHRPVSGEPL